jgi:hypothetical protein
VKSFAELYEEHKNDEDPSGLVKAMYPWRNEAVADRAAKKFAELSAEIDRQMENGASELDAWGSVVLSSIANIIAADVVEAEIKGVLQANRPKTVDEMVEEVTSQLFPEEEASHLELIRGPEEES